MLIFLIHVKVKPEYAAAFRAATEENARYSIAEPGIARFDLLQQAEDPAQFVLLEAYRTAEGPARHRETAHYTVWRDRVEEMMAEPRARVQYSNVFPPDAGW